MSSLSPLQISRFRSDSSIPVTILRTWSTLCCALLSSVFSFIVVNFCFDSIKMYELALEFRVNATNIAMLCLRSG